MWSLQVHHDLVTRTVTFALSIPDSPWTWLICFGAAATTFVFRIYLTERVKEGLALVRNHERSHEPLRKIKEAKDIISAECTQFEKDKVLAISIMQACNRLVAEKADLLAENEFLRSMISPTLAEQGLPIWQTTVPRSNIDLA